MIFGVVFNQKDLFRIESANQHFQKMLMSRTVTGIGKPIAKVGLRDTDRPVDMLGVSLAVGRHEGTKTPAEPTPKDGWVLPESSFVFKDDYSPCLLALFFKEGYVFRTHFCCNSGFAKANFFAGRWTENPI